jgi:hypothetical protein
MVVGLSNYVVSQIPDDIQSLFLLTFLLIQFHLTLNMHIRTNTPAEDVPHAESCGHWTRTDFSDFLHCFCKTYYCYKRDGDGGEYCVFISDRGDRWTKK